MKRQFKLGFYNARRLTMKRLPLSAATILLASLGASTVAQAPQAPAFGKAELEAINQSGVQAQILFLDTGSNEHGLVLSGRATGLDPTQSYFSLLYNIGSVAEGPTACIPAPRPAPQITDAQMFTEFWTVASDGTGTLFRQKTGTAYVPLSDVATVSIRKVAPNQPFGNILQACGEIERKD